MTKEKLAKYFDQTLLKAYADEKTLEAFCNECKQYGFASVMSHSSAVPLCRGVLGENSEVKVGCVVGFPLGEMTIDAKLFEAKEAIQNGADEIDYVINLGKLKSGEMAYLREEMRRIVALCHQNGALCKVIFETCYLTREEIIALSQIAAEEKPDFIKTSTGFGTPTDGKASGATVQDVRLMKETVGGAVRVKASGGIRTLADALSMIEAGAERIGTSAGVQILQELDK